MNISTASAVNFITDMLNYGYINNDQAVYLLNNHSWMRLDSSNEIMEYISNLPNNPNILDVELVEAELV